MFSSFLLVERGDLGMLATKAALKGKDAAEWADYTV